MYHTLGPNSVYDIFKEEKIDIGLIKGKQSYDVSLFLDDISTWMEKHKAIIGGTYLPFGFLSVGSLPVQISAFMFGLFVGKALEKHGVKIKLNRTHMSKDEILKEIEDSYVIR